MQLEIKLSDLKTDGSKQRVNSVPDDLDPNAEQKKGGKADEDIRPEKK